MASSLIALVILCSCQPVHAPVRVISVQDGDSMTVMIGTKEERVRLFGIDAPERGQPFANVARDGLRAQIDNKPIRFKEIERDVNGRIVAWVYASSNPTDDESASINMRQVENGHAWWFRRFAPKNEALKEAEKQARSAGKGLWSDAYPEAPWDFRARNRG